MKKILVFIIPMFIYSSDVPEMVNRDHIIIELSKHNYSAGNFYAIDRDGTLWLSGPVTAGGGKYRTRDGHYNIYRKHRYYMSSKYPDARGINNMNYSMFFNGGIALHQGSVRSSSHGCVHIEKKDVSALFKWAKRGTPVIITNNSIRESFTERLIKIGELGKKRY